MLKFFILVLSTVCADKLGGDFLRGFETGISIRTDDRAFKDFSCPEPET